LVTGPVGYPPPLSVGERRESRVAPSVPLTRLGHACLANPLSFSVKMNFVDDKGKATVFDGTVNLQHTGDLRVLE
jgi:hypothetical protein